MKLNFRDLKKNAFTLEAEPSTLVGDVKKQVAERQSAEVPQIRLIHSGKVLADDKAIETYGIKETDHIICMVQKPKSTVASSSTTTQAPSTPAATTAQTPAAPAPATTTSTTSQNAPGTPTPAGGAPTASSRAFDDTSPLMLGPQRQAAVANMESMGFERPQIERAMRAAFFNPDRAVEFLLNGIPENLQQEAAGRGSGGGGGGSGGGANPAPAAPASTNPSGGDNTGNTSTDPEAVNLFDAAAAAGSNRSGGSGGSTGGTTARSGGSGGAAGGAGLAAGGGGAGGGAGNLDFLRNNPMFQQLRQLVQQDPSMLENVLQQVSAANPQLAQLISQNPEQFLQLVTEGVEGDGLPMPPGASGDIRVTEEERDAIERLINLGFERDLVIQAYFACDKNEELAANFLFDQPHEDEDDDVGGVGGGALGGGSGGSGGGGGAGGDTGGAGGGGTGGAGTGTGGGAGR